MPAIQSSESTRIRSKRAVVGLDELRERRREPSRRLLERQVEQDLHLVAPRHAGRATGSRAPRRRTPRAAGRPSSSSSVVRLMRSIRNVRRSSRRWSCAARYQRAEWTTSPYGLSSRRVRSPEIRPVRGAHAAPAADGVGEQQHGVARDRRARARRGGEAERRLERLDAAAQQVGQHAVDLRERPVGRAPRRCRAPAGARRSARARSTTASSSESISGGRRYPGRTR